MKCQTCTNTMALFERACAAIKALPPAEFVELKARLLANALRDLNSATDKIQ
jgi:hypothetical protein